MKVSSVKGDLELRTHDRVLPDHFPHLVDCIFIIRMLIHQSYWHRTTHNC